MLYSFGYYALENLKLIPRKLKREIKKPLEEAAFLDMYCLIMQRVVYLGLGK